MIVWGGGGVSGYLNTGGRYNPATDSWTAITTTNAPAARAVHTAVGTGSEMIVWGGYDGGFLNTGGRLSATGWTATSTTNAPEARFLHTAVWTGIEMIVWAGESDFLAQLNTGGRYDPNTDSWTATSLTDAPEARSGHTAVWTGNEMIAWGGGDRHSLDRFNTGGRYCASPSVPFTLSAAGRKVGGINTVRLTWSGANSANINVYRDGVVIATTANDGRYIDSTGDTGRARYTYQVCEVGTFTCSNDVRVTFRQ
jgi:hypothetical protein